MTEPARRRSLPPADADGEKKPRCEWCGWPVDRPKSVGRMPRYCRQSCRQRAYEARQTRAEVDAVLALHKLPTGGARSVSSRDETGSAPPVDGPLLKPGAGEDVTLW